VAGALCEPEAGSVVAPPGPLTVEGLASAAPGFGAVCGETVGWLCADAAAAGSPNSPGPSGGGGRPQGVVARAVSFLSAAH